MSDVHTANGFRQRRNSRGFQREWVENPSGTFFTMLNADIGLFRDLDGSDSEGMIACGATSSNNCNMNTVASVFVNNFADDPQAWLDAFVSGYNKMVTIGYNVGTDLIDQSTVSAESVMGNFMDDLIDDLDNGQSVEVNGYFFWIIFLLLVVNIICMTIYYWNYQCKSKNKGYKMVQYDSEVTE